MPRLKQCLTTHTAHVYSSDSRDKKNLRVYCAFRPCSSTPHKHQSSLAIRPEYDEDALSCHFASEPIDRQSMCEVTVRAVALAQVEDYFEVAECIIHLQD